MGGILEPGDAPRPLGDVPLGDAVPPECCCGDDGRVEVGDLGCFKLNTLGEDGRVGDGKHLTAPWRGFVISVAEFDTFNGTTLRTGDKGRRTRGDVGGVTLLRGGVDGPFRGPFLDPILAKF